MLDRRARMCRRIAVTIAIGCCGLLSPRASRADSSGTSYAFGKVVVFDTVVSDKVTYQTTRLLNAVLLDDASALRVVGKVAMASKPSYVSAYSNRGDQLIVLLWDRVEIYDFSDATSPRFVTALQLADQGASTPGYPVIQKMSDEKFILLNTRNTSELTVDAQGKNWTVKPLPPPTAEQRAAMAAPPAPVLASNKPGAEPLLLRDGDKFRYELAWVDRRRPGRIEHRKYVRKMDKVSARTVSEFLLDTQIETVD
jgi:hypothetical protein